jgi:hypothetical protein
MKAVAAQAEPKLGARVVRRTSLLYKHGSDSRADRPEHVRAGSALSPLGGGRLAVIQDDALFVGIVDSSGVRAIELPAVDGARVFDDRRGNKSRKLDLEASIFATVGGMTGLVAFGSGGAATREHVVLVDRGEKVSVVHAQELYAALRATPEFAGTELNVEGSALDGADVVFFQRGNGRGAAIDATGRVDALALFAYLRGEGPCPGLRDIVAWDLGRIGDVRLTFTDGALSPLGSGIAFLACAEACPDALRDGPVSGVAIGRLDDRARTCALGPVVDEKGAPLLDKAEGLAFDADDARHAFVVVDKDDPSVPSELLDLELGEGWLR